MDGQVRVNWKRKYEAFKDEIDCMLENVSVALCPKSQRDSRLAEFYFGGMGAAQIIQRNRELAHCAIKMASVLDKIQRNQTLKPNEIEHNLESFRKSQAGL